MQGTTVILEKCLIFLIFGFFVFIADVGQWSSRSGVIMFTLNYVIWFALIILTLRLSLRRNTANNITNNATGNSTGNPTGFKASYTPDNTTGNAHIAATTPREMP